MSDKENVAVFRDVTTDEDIAAVFALVSEIWPECYAGIITPEQITHMLAHMYAPEVMRTEMANGIAYKMVCVEGVPVGVVSYDLTPNAEGVVTLHKIYLLASQRGRGLGRMMIMHVAESAKAAGARRVELYVNRNNATALRAYEGCGFYRKATRVKDIGDGFVMDDFIMARESL